VFTAAILTAIGLAITLLALLRQTSDDWNFTKRGGPKPPTIH
jgi:hypothetical protein